MSRELYRPEQIKRDIMDRSAKKATSNKTEEKKNVRFTTHLEPLPRVEL